MDLIEYFNETQGLGVLSTADENGKVNAAVYAKPYFVSEQQVAFLTLGRKTHDNLQKNPFAHYLFKEDGSGYKGRRLVLKKIQESKDPEVINLIQKQHFNVVINKDVKAEKAYAVYFAIESEGPLIGSA